MLNVLLHSVTLGDADTKLIQLPADFPPFKLFRYVRSKYPGYCFYESWVGNEDQPAEAIAA